MLTDHVDWFCALCFRRIEDTGNGDEDGDASPFVKDTLVFMVVDMNEFRRVSSQLALKPSKCLPRC